MFRIFYRKFLLRSKNQYAEDVEMLLCDETKIRFITLIFTIIFSFSSIASIIGKIIEFENILIKIIGIIIFIVFIIIYFKIMNRFIERLIYKGTRISNSIYFSIYTLKGKAISTDDFKQIKKHDKYLYSFIKTRECQHYCYQTCFWILQILKKGSIKYIAVKKLRDDNTTKEYTMHVIYVNDGWCFNTFCGKQYKVEELLDLYRAKEFKTFSYSDIAGKSYKEFKKDNYSELKKWCKENDCHQKVV